MQKIGAAGRRQGERNPGMVTSGSVLAPSVTVRNFVSKNVAERDREVVLVTVTVADAGSDPAPARRMAGAVLAGRNRCGPAHVSTVRGLPEMTRHAPRRALTKHGLGPRSTRSADILVRLGVSTEVVGTCSPATSGDPWGLPGEWAAAALSGWPPNCANPRVRYNRETALTPHHHRYLSRS